MAYEVVIKTRFYSKLANVLTYLQKEWGDKVATEFIMKIDARLKALQQHPYIGSSSGIKDTRSISITQHNRMYYRVSGNKVYILNLYDTRRKNYPPDA